MVGLSLVATTGNNQADYRLKAMNLYTLNRCNTFRY